MLNSTSTLLAGSLQAAESTGGSGSNLIMLLLMVVAIIFLFIVPARRQKKMQAQLKERQESMVEGTEVMTNFGLFGTVIEVNREENFAILEVSPGNRVKVHLQTVTTVLDGTESSESNQVAGEQAQISAEESSTSAEGYGPENNGR